MPRSIDRSLFVRLATYAPPFAEREAGLTQPLGNAAHDRETLRVCDAIEAHARTHIRYQTQAANGVPEAQRAAHDRNLANLEARLTNLAARLSELTGKAWRVEFQGRGGGLCVVLALVDWPNAGDSGEGWYIGR